MTASSFTVGAVAVVLGTLFIQTVFLLAGWQLSVVEIAVWVAAAFVTYCVGTFIANVYNSVRARTKPKGARWR